MLPGGGGGCADGRMGHRAAADARREVGGRVHPARCWWGASTDWTRPASTPPAEPAAAWWLRRGSAPHPARC